MQATGQFDSVNKVSEDCGHHIIKRTVTHDLNKLVAQLHSETRVFDNMP